MRREREKRCCIHTHVSLTQIRIHEGRSFRELSQGSDEECDLALGSSEPHVYHREVEGMAEATFLLV